MSLTGFDTINGHSNIVRHGAKFEEIKDNPQHYEKIITVHRKVDWLNQRNENTFNDRSKKRNEKPVKEYRELKLSYDEGFNNGVGGVSKNMMVMFLILCVLCCMVFVLNK